jgi:hypothetical protein
MNRSLLTLAILAVVAFSMPATRAFADLIGVAGPIVGIELNDDTSDEWANYQGKVFIDEGDTVQEYRWQGTACSGKAMSVTQQEILAGGVGKKVVVIPYYQLGVGGVRCIVSFNVAGKKAVPDVTR